MTLSKNGFTNYLRRLCQVFVQNYHPEEYARLYEQARKDTGISNRRGRPSKAEKKVREAVKK